MAKKRIVLRHIETRKQLASYPNEPGVYEKIAQDYEVFHKVRISATIEEWTVRTSKEAMDDYGPPPWKPKSEPNE